MRASCPVGECEPERAIRNDSSRRYRFPQTKVERDGSGNSRLPQLPGGLAFPKSVPDCVFPKRSVEHGETGLLTVGGSAGFGMPSRFTEWPEMARYRPGSLAAARTQLRSFAASFRFPNFCHPFMLAAGQLLSFAPPRFRLAFPKTIVERDGRHCLYEDGILGLRASKATV